ncbi:DUF3953 domain-containing protein [Bacillus sp. 7894-2]|uniref:DUF3953 domain-containing protein n=1 Tax=Bacillus sp. 7894-2 TaxID=2021695 RepID=UPI000BA794E1|nr:DUF3953 domain-containing protein [Bacillus sp. 7894-2]PAE23282.1 hypothetical protein CHI10_18985 [Bacillus sp. 7894-2]
MIKILRIVLSVVIIPLALYMLITHNFEWMPFNLFLLSLFVMVIGTDEFMKGRKQYGVLNFAVSFFIVFVAFYTW